ncbi:MAG: Sigma-54 dependent transcriptional regulator [Myxococcales bacterium]|nr:Sigma-54 dependent transcriptional regulator [Myxococcales bacterium]
MRERREDLGLIAGEILRGVVQDAIPSLTWDAARALFAHDWPLNARELDKLLGTALVLSGGRIERQHLSALDAPPAAAPPPSTPPAPASLGAEDQQLRDALVAAMAEHRGNVAAIARVMDKAPVQIRRWIKRFALDVHLYRR